MDPEIPEMNYKLKNKNHQTNSIKLQLNISNKAIKISPPRPSSKLQVNYHTRYFRFHYTDGQNSFHPMRANVAALKGNFQLAHF